MANHNHFPFNISRFSAARVLVAATLNEAGRPIHKVHTRLSNSLTKKAESHESHVRVGAAVAAADSGFAAWEKHPRLTRFTLSVCNSTLLDLLLEDL